MRMPAARSKPALRPCPCSPSWLPRELCVLGGPWQKLGSTLSAFLHNVRGRAHTPHPTSCRDFWMCPPLNVSLLERAQPASPHSFCLQCLFFGACKAPAGWQPDTSRCLRVTVRPLGTTPAWHCPPRSSLRVVHPVCPLHMQHCPKLQAIPLPPTFFFPNRHPWLGGPFFISCLLPTKQCLNLATCSLQFK